MDLNELNFIEKLEDSFITQVIYFGTNKLWHIRRRSRENSKKYKLLSKKLKTSTKNSIETYENSIANKSKKVNYYMKRKLDNNERIHILRNEEGQVVKELDFIANSLNDHFSSVFEMESYAKKMPNFEPRTDKILSIDLIMQKLSVIEVENRLKKINVRKTLDYDKVHPFVLKKCSHALAIPLSITFRKSLTEVKIPN